MFLFLLIVVMIPVCSVAEANIAEMATDELSALLVSVQQELAGRLNDVPDKNLLFYEDENISIEFFDFVVETETYGSSISFDTLIRNKTEYIADIHCNTLLVNGCSVKVSKHTEILPNAISIHTWFFDADQYLKYKIEKPTNFKMMLDYDLNNRQINNESIITQEVVI